MRISDWSSDVCSSDLPVINRLFPGQIVEHYETTGIRDIGFDQAQEIAGKVRELFEAGAFDVAHLFYSKFRSALVQEATGQRSEEHTSELQSLMRTSYAVFCSKKKNKSNCNRTIITYTRSQD